MASWYKQQLLDWVAQLDVKADRVLDIGGSQHPIKGRTKSWDVKEYKISDLPTPHQGVKPDLELDLNDDKAGGSHDNWYDLIFCLEVFDYVWNPFVAFLHISSLLDDGGSAWITFPFVYPIHNPVDDDALRYTEPAIRRLANETGLKVEEVIYRRPRSTKLLEYYAEDGFRAAPGVDHAVIGYIVRFSK